MDASNFFNTGTVSHELKFGAGYREAEVTSLTAWGQAGPVFDGPAIFGTAPGSHVLELARDGGAASSRPTRTSTCRTP